MPDDRTVTGDPRESQALPDPRVYAYARAEASREGQFSPWIFGQVLIWPRTTRTSPEYFVDYCDRWAEYLGVPPGLAPSTAAAVLHVITSAMSLEADGGRANCFLSYDTVARRSHTHRKTVQRVIAWQRDAAAPLLEMTKAPEGTRGIRHACFRFTLITDPPAFVAGRDAARATKRATFRQRYREQQETGAVFAVQRAAVLDGTSAETTAALARGLTPLVDIARGTMPRRVARGELTATGSLLGRTKSPTETTWRLMSAHQARRASSEEDEGAICPPPREQVVQGTGSNLSSPRGQKVLQRLRT